MSMTTAKTVTDVVANKLTYDNTNSKAEERCVELLEHAGECRAQGVCLSGPHCYRACRVLLHHRACTTLHCCVCRQLKSLCHLHARRCQKKDKSCNIPFCPNGKEPRHVGPRCVTLTETPGTPTCEPCVPVRTAGLLKDQKKTSLNNTNLSITSSPVHQSRLKKLSSPNTYCKMIAYKKETLPQSIFSWKAKVSIVPMK